MADMNRRNVLLGLGTAAAGSGIVFGSGAFTQVEAQRSIDISVNNDSASAVSITPGAAPQGGFATIEEDNDGAIEFSLDDEAINTNATFTVGDDEEFNGSNLDAEPEEEQVAFVIEDEANFTGTDNSLGVQFDLGTDETLDSIGFEFFGDSNDENLNEAGTDNSGEGGIDFSAVESEALTGDGVADQTAKFVLNDDEPNFSGVAAGVITIDTTSGSGSQDVNIDATITAEVVDTSE